jgi:integrase
MPIRKRETKHGTKWQAIVDIGPDPVTGQRRQRSLLCNTEREAKRALAQMLIQVERGQLGPRTVRTVEDLCRAWLETFAQFKSPLTYDGYARSVRLYIVPYLGAIKAQDLKPERVRSWVAKLLTSGKKHRTVHLALLNLHQVLAQAVADGIIAWDATAGIRVPAPEDRGEEMQVWTPEEAQRFLDTAEKYIATYGPIFLVSLSTGMRSGELRGLRWQDVDWTGHELHVRQAVGPDPARHALVIKPLKNKNARRNVLVAGEVLTALREHRFQQTAHRLRLGAAWQDNDLIFCSAVGTPIHASNLWKLYRKIREEASVPRITIHDQRHTHITWALEEHADLKAVSERAGHGNVSVTTTIYQHVGRKLQQDVVDKVAGKLTRRPSPEVLRPNLRPRAPEEPQY